jgi:hypothetical protein
MNAGVVLPIWHWELTASAEHFLQHFAEAGTWL